MLRTGDAVLVWPAGHPERKAEARVQVISANQRSIAVSFPDKPPFPIHDGWAIHPAHGVMLFALREDAQGPWREMLQGRLFEMEKTDGVQL